MQNAYRLKTEIKDPSQRQGTSLVALTGLQVKSLIARIARPSGDDPVIVSGVAWAGESKISKVELSTDSGATWHRAFLKPHKAKYAWTTWDYLWNPQQKGELVVSVRATDDHGRIQPEISQWNSRGYFWNGIDHCRVTIS
jgi:hypothetical protein